MSKLKILILEDDATLCLALETMLEKNGYEVVGTASSGLRAVELFRRTEPQLLLLDIVVKGEMTGIEAGEIMAKERQIPIIYLTAFPEKYIEAKATHPFAFLTKPHNENQLLTAIDLALERLF